MSSRKIPAYRHHKARNLAAVRIDGKDVFLGEYDSPESKTKYERLIADWLQRHHQTSEVGASSALEAGLRGSCVVRRIEWKFQDNSPPRAQDFVGECSLLRGSLP